MLKNLSGIVMLVVLCYVSMGCEKEVVVEIPKAIPSVCIWDDASVRVLPSIQADRISTMALGEKIIWLGGSEVDSTDEGIVYLKIQLSDGSIGWTSEKLIAVDAIPAVAITKAPIFRRPDLVTETSDEFEPMDLVAVTTTKGDWIEVVGEKKSKSGWINSKQVSQKEEDVAVALLAVKATAEKDVDKRIEKIGAILNNAGFSRSVFMADLEKTYMEMTTPQVVDSETDHATETDE